MYVWLSASIADQVNHCSWEGIMSARLEQRTLKLSIATTLTVASLGIMFGLVSGAQSIIFDGVFSAIDSAISALSLFVARLLVRETSQRFQHGYWHLEPLVAALNGTILLVLCFYALINAVRGLIGGGHELDFGPATVYAVIVATICFGMYGYERRINKRVDSEFLRIDTQSWLMAGLITSALLGAFVLAWILESTSYAYLTRYADSFLLTILTLCFIPVPMATIRRAFKEIFLMAPSFLDQEVHDAMEPVMKREGLLEYYSHVAKSGRNHVIEIHVLTTPEFAMYQGVAVMDEIREQISSSINIPPERRWFTVAFTADKRWL